MDFPFLDYFEVVANDTEKDDNINSLEFYDEEVEFVLYNNMTKVVLSKKSKSLTNRFDTSKLRPGTYALHIIYNNEKIIKQNKFEKII